MRKSFIMVYISVTRMINQFVFFLLSSWCLPCCQFFYDLRSANDVRVVTSAHYPVKNRIFQKVQSSL